MDWYGDEYLIVQKDNKYGMMHKSSKMVVPCIYDAIEDPSARYRSVNCILALKDDKYGLIDHRTGEIIFPIEYPYISLWGNRVVLYNYKPCFDCEGMIRSYPNEEPPKEYKGLATMDKKHKTRIKYDVINYIFNNGAAIVTSQGKYIYLSSRMTEKKLR